MIIRIILAFLTFSLIGYIFIGCTSNRQYHGPTSLADKQPELTNSNIYQIKINRPETPQPCKLAFIEFDEMGRLFNVQQISNILKDIHHSDFNFQKNIFTS